MAGDEADDYGLKLADITARVRMCLADLDLLCDSGGACGMAAIHVSHAVDLLDQQLSLLGVGNVSSEQVH